MCVNNYTDLYLGATNLNKHSQKKENQKEQIRVTYFFEEIMESRKS